MDAYFKVTRGSDVVIDPTSRVRWAALACARSTLMR
jgi:hypothetical protein